MEDLFGDKSQSASSNQYMPLAEKLRPKTLDEIVGQKHLLDVDGPIERMLATNAPTSTIFWGPTGVGKTTLARLLAASFELSFVQISAIYSGVAELRNIFEAASIRIRNGGGTLLFVDEIHRFNRAQQDSFLPHMEEGTIILVGATTENPSFELNAALLSRAQILTLKRLDEEALQSLLERAEKLEGRRLPLTDQARGALIAMADGDGRSLLNLAEQIFIAEISKPLEAQDLSARLVKRAPVYDKKGEEHYNLISALHKSVRGSDPDAALYWLCRMLNGGEDPLFIARRLVRMAVEDIGLADANALTLALAAKQTYEFLGSPEGELALAQAAIYLASSPKSNSVYKAFSKAMQASKKYGSVAPPKIILNAPTGLMKELEYGKGYIYDHDTKEGFSGQNYFPDSIPRQSFYQAKKRGFEREIDKRLRYWSSLREAGKTAKDNSE